VSSRSSYGSADGANPRVGKSLGELAVKSYHPSSSSVDNFPYHVLEALQPVEGVIVKVGVLVIVAAFVSTK
jgi:hypothetical protein